MIRYRQIPNEGEMQAWERIGRAATVQPTRRGNGKRGTKFERLFKSQEA